ncbi:cysteine-rich motor neuron 1 protein [Lingula anatina]|uniref:Cysteine-rich motor neuron 1 protein n=1 Tax=Lingula anatina TaxID=7574 RepID=A0A1S3JTM1_LINAN|nr:cysteine-rich motor neuron 1 protein [Lingula anatina]|eukprot:XP_013413451.1 cysteine-rich motor neuron 1 protein [Lingula anatina]
MWLSRDVLIAFFWLVNSCFLSHTTTFAKEHRERGSADRSQSHKKKELSTVSSSSSSSSSSMDLKCPSCDQIHCSPRRASKLYQKCKGGVTLGVCDCCPICAKVEGEDCGGEWNYLGKCDNGLYCKPRSLQHYDDQVAFPGYSGNKMNKIPEGKCTKRPGMVGIQGVPGYCHPKCTPDFCRDNPKAICAAFDVAEVKQSCQGECQHTSCMACRFVNDEPDCGKCAKDDFGCIKKFAKCYKRHTCTRNKFPCKKKFKENGKFMCAVPACLD